MGLKSENTFLIVFLRLYSVTIRQGLASAPSRACGRLGGGGSI